MFNELRNKYNNFYFNSYKIEDNENDIKIIFDFEIEGLTKFNPSITIQKDNIKNDYKNKFFENLVFNLGMVELVSYFKSVCCKNIIIKAGYLNDEQVSFFKKLYYYGLGEFLYLNKIDISMDELINIVVDHEKEEVPQIDYNGCGNIIPVGGGKDSCVSLELLKHMDNTCFVINPKGASLDCVHESGNPYIFVKRVIDKNLIELNNKGFLNGHTPFSAIVAFTSYIAAYLNNKEYIVLSNEGSANESTVIGTKINHQYSKTFEFECDFNNYAKKYLNSNIKYFSFLRPISEFQIGMIFSSLERYHKIFKSCNVGSKGENWVWCSNCAKCLFVYIILSPFLSREKLVDIFGYDLYENKELLETFKELLGYSDTKPFECVGTYNECRYAVSSVINKCDNKEELSYLLKYYYDNYDLDFSFKNEYNDENNLPSEFEEILKRELMKFDK